MEIGYSLILGVISGIIATSCMIIIRSYWHKVLQPWYEELVYKDAHIEGSWQGNITILDSDALSLKFNILRQGHNVNGTMIAMDNGKTYSFRGEFRNMILTITYDALENFATDRGCFTFLLTKNGQELDGQGAFYYGPKHCIASASVKLTRTTNTESLDIS